MKKIKKKYKNLLFDLFAEGFDLVFGSSGKKQWYAGLLSDCEEDIDGILYITTRKTKNVKPLVKKKHYLFLRDYIITLFASEMNWVSQEQIG